MDDSEIAAFGALYRAFLDRVVDAAPRGDGGQPLAERLREFLGVDPTELPVVAEDFFGFEHATVQVAINRLLDRPGVRHELIGVAGPGRGDQSLTEILEMSHRHRHFWVGSVDYAAVPVSADEEHTCVRFGLYLIDDADGKIAVLVRTGSPHEMVGPRLEVLAPSPDHARAWLVRLRDERAVCNLLRRQVLSFEPSPFEPSAGPIRFHRRPTLSRDDVVLPAGVLERVERQVVGVARHRDRLLSEGRHLKRGVLLYGPPGTGKTHTVRYLTGALREFTVILLAGPAIAMVSQACALARTVQPALIVLEDCDLIAEDRSFTPGGNPLLFTILDEMDGLGADSDVCFLLTTNRVDLLEAALAQRPGRVDLALEIQLPDLEGRRRLLEIYGRGIELTAADADAIVERITGVPASFLKEMSRRATLLAADRGAAVTGADDVHAAIDELSAAQETLTRRLLGTSEPADGGTTEPAPAAGLAHDVEPGPGIDPAPGGPARRGWFAYRPNMPRRYGGYG